MDKLLAQLVERLQKAYGERLVSVVLYGSAAAGDHQAKFSDYNILCVLSEITPRELGAGRGHLPLVARAVQPRAASADRAGSGDIDAIVSRSNSSTFSGGTGCCSAKT